MKNVIGQIKHSVLGGDVIIEKRTPAEVQAEILRLEETFSAKMKGAEENIAKGFRVTATDLVMQCEDIQTEIEYQVACLSAANERASELN